MAVTKVTRKKSGAQKIGKPNRMAHDGSVEIEGVRVTHPDRVLFAAQNVTKRAIIDYYIPVAGRMLPYIVDRPISLVRCPRGSGKDCFFQKHASDGFPEEFARSRSETSRAARIIFISRMFAVWSPRFSWAFWSFIHGAAILTMW